MAALEDQERGGMMKLVERTSYSVEFVVTRLQRHMSSNYLDVAFADPDDPSDMPHAFSLTMPIGLGLVEGQRVRFMVCVEPLEG
jgi:hypothetical protein